MSSLLVDEYRKSLATRYIREAGSDLEAAKNTPIASISVNLAILAMRKMQNAIYYALGNPSYLSVMVESALREGVTQDDPLIRFLAHTEWLIQFRSVNSDSSKKEDALREARQLMKATEEIVEKMI